MKGAGGDGKAAVGEADENRAACVVDGETLRSLLAAAEVGGVKDLGTIATEFGEERVLAARKRFLNGVGSDWKIL